MRCRSVRKALVDRSQGRLAARACAALEAHVAACRECAAAAADEEAIASDLVSLRGPAPFEVDVRERVLAAVSGTESAPVEEVGARELGFGVAAGIAAALLVLVIALAAWPEWLGLPGDGAKTLARGALRIDDVAHGLASLIAPAVKVLLALGGAAVALVDAARPYEGYARGVFAAIFAIVIAFTAWTVGREFRRKAPDRARGAVR